MTLKEAIEDTFNLLGVGYKEMTLDDIALEIQDKNLEYKDYDLDLLRKQVSSFMANATTKTVKGKRVIDKESKYERVKNGKGGYKKGVYKLRKPKLVKPQIERPPIDPSPNISCSDNTLYIGSAGEMSVCSELLFRGYNVSRMSVDDGVDIVAIKNGKTYYIQVKTVLVKSKNFGVKISEKSFERYCSNDCYYIVVARTSTKEGVPFNQYIVLTADNIRYLHGSGDIKSSNGVVNIGFSQNDGHIFIKDFKVDQMLNCFERIF